MDYPITLEAFLTVPGVGLATALVMQILKRELPDWRWTNIVSGGVGILLAVLAQLLLTDFAPSGQAVFETVMVGLFGAATATYGYEVVQNARGIAGSGPRA